MTKKRTKTPPSERPGSGARGKNVRDAARRPSREEGTVAHMTTAEVVRHIKQARDAEITVGVNPPGLLQTAVELADQRTPQASLAAAVFAAEAARHLLAEGQPTPALFKLQLQAAALSEELRQYVVHSLERA